MILYCDTCGYRDEDVFETEGFKLCPNGCKFMEITDENELREGDGTILGHYLFKLPDSPIQAIIENGIGQEFEIDGGFYREYSAVSA